MQLHTTFSFYTTLHLHRVGGLFAQQPRKWNRLGYDIIFRGLAGSWGCELSRDRPYQMAQWMCLEITEGWLSGKEKRADMAAVKRVGHGREQRGPVFSGFSRERDRKGTWLCSLGSGKTVVPPCWEVAVGLSVGHYHDILLYLSKWLGFCWDISVVWTEMV